MAGFDYESEQQDLRRRLQIAEAMMSGGLAPLGPTESVGGVAIAKSPLEGLAKVAQVYASRKTLDKLKGEQGDLNNRYKQEGKAGVERFLSSMYGDSLTMPDQGDAYGGTMQFPADPKRAVLEALVSPHEGVRQMGMASMKQMGSDKLDLKTLAAMATPESVLKNPTNPQAWAAKRNLSSATPGSVMYDEAGNVTQLGSGAGTPPQAPGTVTPGLPSGPGWQTLKIGGDLYQQTSTGLKKLDNATKVNISPTTTVTVAGQKAGMEAWAKKAADTVAELSESARQSVKLETQLNQLDALTKGGTNAGPLADAQTFVQGLANSAGIKVDKNQLSNSQAFNSVATQAWAALMQQNGGARGLVKEESEKLAQSLPSLSQTPQGRAQIIAVLKQQAQMNIRDAQKANEEFSKAVTAENPGLFTYGLSSTQLPQSPPQSPAPGGAMPSGRKPSVSNW
jgi:hypothetical protein